ncbi:MAG: adenylyltransferase/cytidyltransferase family protein [Acholeplasmatales bacterium]|nr:adenylyltransferase/cytidyltransferase family protein [Acholeplasmatales bacterium]
MKEYKLGLVLGRFQVFHKGHELIINTALEHCEKVLIFIGSSDKSNTYENPFDYDFRLEIIKSVYDNHNIIIAPLADLAVGDVPKWGKYVMESAINVIGMPDCIIYGIEEKCEYWYKDYQNLAYLKVDRCGIDISSTKLKKIILEDNYADFKQYVNPKIIKYYPIIRKKLIELNKKS